MQFHDADTLIHLLDSQFDYLLRHKRQDLLRRLPRLLDFIEREPRLSGLISDFIDETENTRREFVDAEYRIRSELEELWRANQRLLRNLLEDEWNDDRLHAYLHLDSFEKVMREAPERPDAETIGFDDHSQTLKLINALSHATGIAVANARERMTEMTDELQAMKRHLEHLRLRRQHSFRAWGIVSTAKPGLAFERLKSIVRKLNPLPPSVSSDIEQNLLEYAHFVADESLAGLVHDARKAPIHAGRDFVDVAEASVRRDAHLLQEELRAGIAAGRSRLALVRRYAYRATSFDRARLRMLAEKDTRNAERTLTLDFARFLFDQGLNPLVDATMGGLRPDVTSFDRADMFYVEAKQYADKSPRSALVQAYRQVWSTWATLRHNRSVPEAFLVVFRRSGPLVELPSELRHGGLRLYSVLVDIADDSGSREKHRSIVIEENEVLPTSGI